MFLWTTLFSLACAYLSQAEQIPHGKFCGIAMGLHINLSFTDSSHLDFNMTPDGSKVMCLQEPFEFDQSSGKIFLVSYNKARNQTDCLYLPFKRAADDPESVGFVYDASQNSIRFMMDTVTSLLSPAMCGLDHVSAHHAQTSLRPSLGPKVQPRGLFCGTAMGLHMNINFTDASHLDLNMMVNSEKVACPHEIYEIDASSGKIALTSYDKDRNQTDCLYFPFKRVAEDPESVGFVYESSQNAIRFMMDTVTSLLSPAMCGLNHIPSHQPKPSLEPSSVPAGEYCGNILSLARISVKVIDATHMDIDMKVFGTDLFCPREPYSFESSTGLITLTGVHNAKDCLKLGFEKQGQDASTVGLTYSADAGSFHVVVTGVGTDLTRASCAKKQELVFDATIVV